MSVGGGANCRLKWQCFISFSKAPGALITGNTVCYFYWVDATFLMQKRKILVLFINALPTNRPTDTAYYRDVRGRI